MRRLSIAFITVYQHTLGPVLGLMSACRYEPTCSHYGQQAIERFGARRGWWLAVRRICRCRPGGGQGLDPVPEHYMSWREVRRHRHAPTAGGEV
jgi:putative membrane protein insertion efficiency factor